MNSVRFAAQRSVAKGAALATSLLLAAIPAQAVTSIPVWSANFETGQVSQAVGPFPATLSYSAGGATGTGAQSLPGFGRRFLRNSTRGTTSFTFTNLGDHESLSDGDKAALCADDVGLCRGVPLPVAPAVGCGPTKGGTAK